MGADAAKIFYWIINKVEIYAAIQLALSHYAADFNVSGYAYCF